MQHIGFCFIVEGSRRSAALGASASCVWTDFSQAVKPMLGIEDYRSKVLIKEPRSSMNGRSWPIGVYDHDTANLQLKE